jgi:hypothetical protein
LSAKDLTSSFVPTRLGTGQAALSWKERRSRPAFEILFFGAGGSALIDPAPGSQRMRFGIAPAHRPERTLGSACAALFLSQTLASSCGGCERQPTHTRAVCLRLRGGGMPWREHFTSRNFESTGASSAYTCECGADLTLSTDVLSKSFQVLVVPPPPAPYSLEDFPTHSTRPCIQPFVHSYIQT